MWEFIQQNWGSVASVAGLIISVFTLLFAKRASEAATEAKEGVLKRNIADDLQEAARKSQEILVYLEVNKWGAAKQRASELDTVTVWMMHRWANQLGSESRSNLARARNQLRLVIEFVDKIVENDISEQPQANLFRAADKAREIFFEELGRFQAKID